MRDDFPKSVVEKLAKRVGNRCSNPDCRKLTSGPHTEESKVINIGVAAHITAASPGGPRFNAGLSQSQRKGIENGIWLCQSCAKLIDNDEKRFPDRLLLQWKVHAEQQAFQEIRSPRLNPPINRDFCVATHIDTFEEVCISDCERHGKPVAPSWLDSSPERMCSDWLVERLTSNADLRLFYDPKWCGGIWFVVDLKLGDGVVINQDQLNDLRPPSPTTTTSTPTPPPIQSRIV
jgi:hypothetical protein